MSKNSRGRQQHYSRGGSNGSGSLGGSNGGHGRGGRRHPHCQL